MHGNGRSPAEDAEKRMREIVESAGLRQPDETSHDPEAQELLLLWHAEKLAVVIELDKG